MRIAPRRSCDGNCRRGWNITIRLYSLSLRDHSISYHILIARGISLDKFVVGVGIIIRRILHKMGNVVTRQLELVSKHWFSVLLPMREAFYKAIMVTPRLFEVVHSSDTPKQEDGTASVTTRCCCKTQKQKHSHAGVYWDIQLRHVVEVVECKHIRIQIDRVVRLGQCSAWHEHIVVEAAAKMSNDELKPKIVFSYCLGVHLVGP